MMPWLFGSPLTKLIQLKNNLFGTSRKRTLEVSRSDGDHQEEEEEDGEPASKIPRVQVQALLTHEILAHILTFVSVGDLKSCRLVNKHWNSVATNRWKNRGVVLRVGDHWGSSMMDFVNYSLATGNTSSVTTSHLLNKASGLSAVINLEENPVTIPAFVTLCQSRLKTLKLIMALPNCSKDSEEYQARLNSIKQLLTTFLANLEHLTLDFEGYDADILFDPKHKFSSTPTKLKRLEILQYKCDVGHAGLGQGFLAELIAQSHNLEALTFEQSNRAWDANLPCCCYKLLFNLLNSENGGRQLTKVKELNLTFKASHPGNCRFCRHAAGNNGEAAEEESGVLLQNSQLQALSFSRIPWKEMLSTLLYHQHTLERLEIGVHVLPLPPSDNDGSGGGGGGAEPDHAVVLPNLWEFKADVQLSYPFFTTLLTHLTLYPQLGSLALTNPTAEQLRFMWKHFVQLHTLSLRFVENSGVDELSSTAPQDPHASNIVHLDSLLSGYSINTCELIYTKIAADQAILSKSLSQPRPLLSNSNTIRNLAKLRRLEITRASDDLYPIRLTEVGLVLVLLKLSSLTHLTINSCTMLLPGTMPLIEHHVSPAMTISISEQAEYKMADLSRAKAEWL